MGKKVKSITITLAEFKEFSDTVDENWYYEEEIIPLEFWDEPGKYDPAEKIRIDDGDIWICWQGDGDPPNGIDAKEFIAEYRKWKTGIDYKTLVIKVDKKDEKRIRELLKENKVKVEG
jgi:hypothetical protein